MSRLSKINIGIFIVGAVLIVPMVLLHPDEMTQPIRYAFLVFLEKLGDAFVIAAILGAFVERALQQEKMPEFFRDLAVEVFGKALPERLREYVRGYFTITLVRPSWDITYVINKPATGNDIELTVESRYEVVNYSDAAQNYSFEYFIEEPAQTKPSQFVSVTAAGVTYSDDQLKTLVQPVDGYKRFSLPRPISLKPDKSASTFHAKSIQYFRDYVVSPYWATYPVIETTFTVYYSIEQFDVRFEVTEGDTPTQTLVDDGGKKGSRWTIKRPILPGQGFLVRCARRQTSVPAL